MQSTVYKKQIRNIIRNLVNKKFPGLKNSEVTELVHEAAKSIHARFYGSAVDGVASPIWRDDDKYKLAFSDAKPTKTAKELLE